MKSNIEATTEGHIIKTGEMPQSIQTWAFNKDKGFNTTREKKKYQADVRHPSIPFRVLSVT